MSSYQRVHERVNVTVSFYENNVPVVHGFQWQDKIIKIDKVEMVNAAKKGTEPVFLFSVASKEGAYKLRLDTSTLKWWLEEVYWGL